MLQVVIMNRLETAIERLYTAFCDVRKPRHIEGCPCCIDSREIDTLLGTWLRDIAPEVLSPYASSALLTVGNIVDYLYFLPRILEISAKDASWWPSPEVTGRAIRSAKFESWPAARTEALTEFLGAVIQNLLESGNLCEIDCWMCAIGRMGLDVQPYLDIIASSRDALLSYFDDNVNCLRKGRLCNAFWELPCTGHDAIVRWFQSEPIRRIPREEYGFEF